LKNNEFIKSIQFQKELASLVLKDANFCGKVNSLFKARVGEIFSSVPVRRCVELLIKTYNENETTIPSMGVLEHKISTAKMSDLEKQSIKNVLEEIKGLEIQNKTIHEAELIKLLKAFRITDFYNETVNKFMAKDPGEILGLEAELRKFNDSLSAISFGRPDVVDMSSFFNVIDDYSNGSQNNIPSGIPELDEVLNGGGAGGGFSRQELAIILAGVNDGKSLTCVGIAANAARKGIKVLYINLEGRKLQPAMRMISNFSKVPYKKLLSTRDARQEGRDILSTFTRDELKSIKLAEERYSANLKVLHKIGSSDIFEIEATLEETYKEWPFDMVIIDYAQHITASSIHGKLVDQLSFIFRKLEVLAAKYNCAMITPMQVNRGGLNELRQDAKTEPYPTYKMDHVAEVKKAVDLAATIITYNRTPEERKDCKGRFCILKQREGETGLQVGIKSNFSCMDMLEGDRYYIGKGEPNKDNSLISQLTGILSGTGSDTKKTMVESAIINRFGSSDICDLTTLCQSIESLTFEINKITVENGYTDLDETVKEQISALESSVDNKVIDLNKNKIYGNIIGAIKKYSVSIQTSDFDSMEGNNLKYLDTFFNKNTELIAA
jgi:hypothetical protein